MMKKGDIVYGRNNLEGGHPILYLQSKDEYSFIGAMLTKTGNYKGNIRMSDEHFKEKDINGKSFTFHFNSTHLVGHSLLKNMEWEPFEKVGELTDEGLKFVESVLVGKEPILWEEYRRK